MKTSLLPNTCNIFNASHSIVYMNSKQAIRKSPDKINEVFLSSEQPPLISDSLFLNKIFL